MANELPMLLFTAKFRTDSPRPSCRDYTTQHEKGHFQKSSQHSNAETAQVIPIILKPVDWRGAPFDGLDVLPKNKKPITSWSNREEAFLDVSQGIRDVVEEMNINP
jgi:hypothetical protein